MTTITEHAKQVKAQLTAGDAVWIAAALLQREAPESILQSSEILTKVQSELLTDVAPNTVAQHISQHCVASLPAQPNRLKMLTAHGRGERTLYREGDPVHPDRLNGRKRPEPKDIPARYHDLIRWYDAEWYPRPAVEDPLLALAGSGHGLWPTDAVAYIRELRSDPLPGAPEAA